jgi:lipopolysaccharide biosynthesis protein
MSPEVGSSLRAIAFYLPQFHPIAENDRWWGKGFTEWTNVVRARPLFRRHYQPHLPADLGFYDLRVPEVREAQAALARAHGIHGFCYYHYWFNGVRLLHRPLDEVLRSGRPNLPFCVCWANENWTRRWDGFDSEILVRQEYSPADDEAHIAHLLPTFADERYLRIDGSPLFLVYRTELLPEPARTAELWRQRAREAGFPGLYLVRVESFRSNVDPRSIGFDAAVEFAPDKTVVRPSFRRALGGPRARALAALRRLGLASPRAHEHRLYSYRELVERSLAKPTPPWKRFRCVTPGWDNSPRRATGANIFLDSTPELYAKWLADAARQTLDTFEGDERIVFVNAWNEWAEGNHLEPDQRWGRAYLEATSSALTRAATAAVAAP